MEKIIVTRHQGLVDYLLEKGIVSESVPVFNHANVDIVKGKHVYGVLPLSLAVHASKITEVAMSLPQEMRGVDLSLKDMKRYAGDVTTYTVSIESCNRL